MLSTYEATNTAAVNAAAFGNVLSPIVTNIINPLIALAFAVAIVVFTYGVIQLIINKTDAEAHTKGRWAILGGVIGMFLMLSAWGIIRLISNTVMEFR